MTNRESFWVEAAEAEGATGDPERDVSHQRQRHEGPGAFTDREQRQILEAMGKYLPKNTFGGGRGRTAFGGASDTKPSMDIPALTRLNVPDVHMEAADEAANSHTQALYRQLPGDITQPDARAIFHAALGRNLVDCDHLRVPLLPGALVTALGQGDCDVRLSTYYQKFALGPRGEAVALDSWEIFAEAAPRKNNPGSNDAHSRVAGLPRGVLLIIDSPVYIYVSGLQNSPEHVRHLRILIVWQIRRRRNNPQVVASRYRKPLGNSGVYALIQSRAGMSIAVLQDAIDQALCIWHEKGLPTLQLWMLTYGQKTPIKEACARVQRVHDRHTELLGSAGPALDLLRKGACHLGLETELHDAIFLADVPGGPPFLDPMPDEERLDDRTHNATPAHFPDDWKSFTYGIHGRCEGGVTFMKKGNARDDTHSEVPEAQDSDSDGASTVSELLAAVMDEQAEHGARGHGDDWAAQVAVEPVLVPWLSPAEGTVEGQPKLVECLRDAYKVQYYAGTAHLTQHIPGMRGLRMGLPTNLTCDKAVPITLSLLAGMCEFNVLARGSPEERRAFKSTEVYIGIERLEACFNSLTVMLSTESVKTVLQKIVDFTFSPEGFNCQLRAIDVGVLREEIADQVRAALHAQALPIERGPRNLEEVADEIIKGGLRALPRHFTKHERLGAEGRIALLRLAHWVGIHPPRGHLEFQEAILRNVQQRPWRQGGDLPDIHDEEGRDDRPLSETLWAMPDVEASLSERYPLKYILRLDEIAAWVVVRRCTIKKAAHPLDLCGGTKQRLQNTPSLVDAALYVLHHQERHAIEYWDTSQLPRRTLTTRGPQMTTFEQKYFMVKGAGDDDLVRPSLRICHLVIDALQQPEEHEWLRAWLPCSFDQIKGMIEQLPSAADLFLMTSFWDVQDAARKADGRRMCLKNKSAMDGTCVEGRHFIDATLAACGHLGAQIAAEGVAQTETPFFDRCKEHFKMLDSMHEARNRPDGRLAPYYADGQITQQAPLSRVGALTTWKNIGSSCFFNAAFACLTAAERRLDSLFPGRTHCTGRLHDALREWLERPQLDANPLDVITYLCGTGPGGGGMLNRDYSWNPPTDVRAKLPEEAQALLAGREGDAEGDAGEALSEAIRYLQMEASEAGQAAQGGPTTLGWHHPAQIQRAGDHPFGMLMRFDIECLACRRDPLQDIRGHSFVTVPMASEYAKQLFLDPARRVSVNALIGALCADETIQFRHEGACNAATHGKRSTKLSIPCGVWGFGIILNGLTVTPSFDWVAEVQKCPQAVKDRINDILADGADDGPLREVLLDNLVTEPTREALPGLEAFELSAVIWKRGARTAGHYLTRVKGADGRWYEIDDHKVRLAEGPLEPRPRNNQRDWAPVVLMYMQRLQAAAAAYHSDTTAHPEPPKDAAAPPMDADAGAQLVPMVPQTGGGGFAKGTKLPHGGPRTGRQAPISLRGSVADIPDACSRCGQNAPWGSDQLPWHTRGWKCPDHYDDPLGNKWQFVGDRLAEATWYGKPKGGVTRSKERCPHPHCAKAGAFKRVVAVGRHIVCRHCHEFVMPYPAEESAVVAKAKAATTKAAPASADRPEGVAAKAKAKPAVVAKATTATANATPAAMQGFTGGPPVDMRAWRRGVARYAAPAQPTPPPAKEAGRKRRATT
jgi:hypothetical protein